MISRNILALVATLGLSAPAVADLGNQQNQSSIEQNHKGQKNIRRGQRHGQRHGQRMGQRNAARKVAQVCRKAGLTRPEMKATRAAIKAFRTSAKANRQAAGKARMAFHKAATTTGIAAGDLTAAVASVVKTQETLVSARLTFKADLLQKTFAGKNLKAGMRCINGLTRPAVKSRRPGLRGNRGNHGRRGPRSHP